MTTKTTIILYRPVGPAEALQAFNAAIVGPIEVIRSFGGTEAGT